MTELSWAGRFFVILLFLCALLGTIMQFTLTVFFQNPGLEGLFSYITKMTNWNVLAGLAIAAAILFAPRSVLAQPMARAAMVPLMIIVFVLYEALLRGTSGAHALPQRLTTNLLHDLVPWLFVISFVLLPHRGLPWRAAAWAMLLPFGYLVFGLFRGLVDDFWAYWFLDPTNVGWLDFVRNVVLILSALTAMGLVVVAVERWLYRRKQRLGLATGERGA